ncbi:hypothetical protein TWF730_003544 [Orbilia blumenaviensis]|uniref:Uncharacterized protein n=1 Tax=Orbilia blumenaviensis TaxID=1796055 RepID=A0AAV9U402_9PEZI
MSRGTQSSIIRVHDPADVPAGFNPHRADDRALERAGYLPRPDSALSPHEYALWDSIAKRNPSYTHTKPTVVEPRIGLYEARNWSGGILPVLPTVYNPSATRVLDQKDPFQGVVGSWIVPNPHPQKVFRNGTLINRDGDYWVYTWVGLDGWESVETLKIGVAAGVLVEAGRIVKKESYAAVFYRRKADDSLQTLKLEGFDAEPGDLITASVYGVGESNANNYWIANQGSNEYASGQLPDNSGLTLQGKSAEWLAAGLGPLDSQGQSFPNFGATVFIEGLARQQSGGVQGIERALLTNALDLDSAAERGHNIIIRTTAFLQAQV